MLCKTATATSFR